MEASQRTSVSSKGGGSGGLDSASGINVNSFNQNRSFLKCKFFNARCLYNKFAELRDLVLEECLDIVAICETWLSSDINEAEFAIPGYKVFRKDRDLKFYEEGTYSMLERGGVLLLIRDYLDPEEYIQANVPAEIIWCTITVGHQKTLIGAAYRPERGKLYNLEKICDSVYKTEIDNLILVGDFNFPKIDWTNCNSQIDLDNVFLTMVEENALQQLVFEPTRGDNILDLLLTSNTDLIEDLYVDEPFSNSDHMSLNFNIKFLAPRVCYEPRKVYLYSKGDYESMNQEISLIQWNTLFNGKTVNEKWSTFKETYNQLIDKHIPVKVIKQGQKMKPSWLKSKSVKKARRARRKSWKKLKERGLHIDKVNYDTVKSEYSSRGIV